MSRPTRRIPQQRPDQPLRSKQGLQSWTEPSTDPLMEPSTEPLMEPITEPSMDPTTPKPDTGEIQSSSAAGRSGATGAPAVGQPEHPTEKGRKHAKEREKVPHL
jgi:hypothetical protein